MDIPEEIPEDIEYYILNKLTTKELRPMRLVSKSWKKTVDELRIIKLEERVIINKMNRVYQKWTLYTILSVNCKRNFNTWTSKKKPEEREIILF